MYVFKPSLIFLYEVATLYIAGGKLRETLPFSRETELDFRWRRMDQGEL